MKLLTNSNGSYLTGDALADAVMRYGLVLARRRELDVVDIPYLNADGFVLRVQLTVGWNAETTATTRDGVQQTLTESETTRAMHEKADRFEVRRAYPFDSDELARLGGQHRDTAEWI